MGAIVWVCVRLVGVSNVSNHYKTSYERTHTRSITHTYKYSHALAHKHTSTHEHTHIRTLEHIVAFCTHAELCMYWMLNDFEHVLDSCVCESVYQSIVLCARAPSSICSALCSCVYVCMCCRCYMCIHFKRTVETPPTSVDGLIENVNTHTSTPIQTHRHHIMHLFYTHYDFFVHFVFVVIRVSLCFPIRKMVFGSSWKRYCS